MEKFKRFLRPSLSKIIIFVFLVSLTLLVHSLVSTNSFLGCINSEPTPSVCDYTIIGKIINLIYSLLVGPAFIITYFLTNLSDALVGAANGVLVVSELIYLYLLACLPKVVTPLVRIPREKKTV